MRGRPRAAAAPRCAAGAQRDGAAGQDGGSAAALRNSALPGAPTTGPRPRPAAFPAARLPEARPRPGIAPRSSGRIRKRRERRESERGPTSP